MTLAGPFLTACALLVVAGVLKAARPADTARALGTLVPGLPLRWSVLAVRCLAAGEAVLGAAAVAWPRPPLAAAVAASYAAFTVVVLVVRHRGGPLASCGCFGTPDTPASRLHVAVDVLLAAAAVAVAADPPGGGAFGELTTQPWHGAPLAAVAVLGAWLVVLALGPAARLGALATAVRAWAAAPDVTYADAPAHAGGHGAAHPVPMPVADPVRRDPAAQTPAAQGAPR